MRMGALWRLSLVAGEVAALVASANPAVASGDGLTVISLNSATGDIASISSPGHEPLALDPGSGSFIGYRSNSQQRASINPNTIIARCNASDPSQMFDFLPSGRILTAGGSLCLDVWNCGTANGTVVDLYPCDSGPTCGDPSRTIN
jgi:hypothetical protein